MIPYGRQDINQDDVDAVVEVLRSDFLTQGPKVPEFEAAITDYCAAGYAVAVNSATSALHLACLALELGKDDILWTSPISYVASSNAALYCGASVDFIDVDYSTGNLSINALKEKLSEAEKEGCLPKIIMPVHYAGQSCDMREIYELSKIYGFSIIEDASHAIGGQYLNDKIGHCRFSDITVFSFHPVKIITTAEGGLLTTHDETVARRLAHLRSHGITRDKAELEQSEHGDWYYEQQALGFNYRMTEIQAALGISQLTRIDDYVAHREQMARRYDEALTKWPIDTLSTAADCVSARHLYPILLREGDTKARKNLFETLRDKGIGVNVHYIPIYLQPYYQGLGFKSGHCPEAERFYASCLSIPLYGTLSLSDQDYIIEQLGNWLAKR